MNGQIIITESALAALIGLTAHEVPGVVGMAPASFREGILKVLGRAQSREGVVINRDDHGKYTADLFIVVAYGVSIPTVAQNITERVEHAVRTMTGIDALRVRVHAVGVRHG